MRNALSMCHYKSFRFGNQSKRRTKTNDLKKAAAAAATATAAAKYTAQKRDV